MEKPVAPTSLVNLPYLFAVLVTIIAIVWMGCGGGDEPSPKKGTGAQGTAGNQTSGGSDANGTDGSGQTPAAGDQTTDLPTEDIQKLVDGLGNNRPSDVWDVLPKGYQRDVESLFQDLAQIDPEVHAKLFAVLKHAAAVGSAKKPIIQQVLKARIPENATNSIESQLVKEYDNLHGFVDAIANSELADLAWLRNPAMGAFMSGSGTKIMTSGVALSQAFGSPTNELVMMRGATVKAFTGTTNIVEMTTSGNQTIRWLCEKQDGKWLPKPYIDAWSGLMNWGRGRIQPYTPQVLDPQLKLRYMEILDGVDKALMSIEQSQNAVQLNQFYPQITVAIGRFFGKEPPPTGRLIKWSYGGAIAGLQRLDSRLYFRVAQSVIEKDFGKPDQVFKSQNPQIADVYWIYKGLEIYDARQGQKNAPLRTLAFGLQRGIVVSLQAQ